MTHAPPIVWFVVPDGIDDPQRVSGGNVFDRRVADGLRDLGWDVRIVKAGTDVVSPADPFRDLPDGAVALVDGLVAIEAPDAVVAASRRLRIVALVHMLAAAFDGADPAAVAGERAALPRAQRIIAVSGWLRDELARRGLGTAGRIAVAPPGADEAPTAQGTSTGGSLLCVGVVAPHKGQDTLVEALAGLDPGASWQCTIAGSLVADPPFAHGLASAAARAGVADRIAWTGVLDEDGLGAVYARTDVLVAPSRTESYGIAVGEALRRGIPVIASLAGGIPEAARPAEATILLPPGDAGALGAALRQWLEDRALRARLTRAARRAAPDRPRWSDTARSVHEALAGLS
ncbi:glycosyltransferase family 4 protein [Microbacterium sp. HJ5]